MQPDDRISEITVYLKRLSAGDVQAESPLADAVYARMRQLARGVVRGQSANVSLEPTALVNEVLLELVRLRSIDWQDRVHFFRVAARLLRRRFLDYIRARRAQRRSPAGEMLELSDDLLVPSPERFDEIILVDEALRQLAEFDAGLAETVELVYFGGFTIADVAALRKVNEKTIDRHLEVARRWIAARFNAPCPSLSIKTASKD